MAIEQRVLDARRRAGEVVPATLRHVMTEQWKKVNYSELSRRTGVPISTVRNHLTGFNPIPSDDLLAYAAALGVPDWLLTRPPDEATAWLRRHAGEDPDSLTRAIPGSVNSGSSASTRAAA